MLVGVTAVCACSFYGIRRPAAAGEEASFQSGLWRAGLLGGKAFSINQKLGEFLKHHRRINAAKTGFQVLVVLLFLLVGCQQRSSAGTASYFTVVAHVKSNGHWTTSLL